MPAAAAIIDVGGEREEREVLSIHVVLEVEHAGEAGSGYFRFGPRAVRILRGQEIMERTLHACAVKIAAGANPHKGPRGLRCGALPTAFGFRIVVRRAGFAPAAIRVLATL